MTLRTVHRLSVVAFHIPFKNGGGLKCGLILYVLHHRATFLATRYGTNSLRCSPEHVPCLTCDLNLVHIGAGWG